MGVIRGQVSVPANMGRGWISIRRKHKRAIPGGDGEAAPPACSVCPGGCLLSVLHPNPSRARLPGVISSRPRPVRRARLHVRWNDCRRFLLWPVLRRKDVRWRVKELEPTWAKSSLGNLSFRDSATFPKMLDAVCIVCLHAVTGKLSWDAIV